MRADSMTVAALRREAQSVDTGPLGSTVPIELVVPPSSGTANAAEFYMAAINRWNARRLPYLKNRKLNPFADEPMPDPAEIQAMFTGAEQSRCDFYEKMGGHPRFGFVNYPTPKALPMELAIDPFAMRPYIDIVRLVAQGLLNRGKKLEKSGSASQAERFYQSVIRFGWHLGQNPGSILDVQIGLELQQKGLHYLDFLYGSTKNAIRQRILWRYADSLRALAERVESKFTQLGNPEAAIVVLRIDSSAIWRIQAAASLAIVRDTNAYGWLESWRIKKALRAARSDPDESVRRCASYLLTRPPTSSAVPAAKVLAEAGH